MRSFALVFFGGAAGTLTRHGINEWAASDRLFPFATMAVNITGSCLLGLVLTAVALRSGTDEHRRRLRLLIGTGFLGGYTTYSTLAVETDQLLRDGHGWIALTYIAGSAVLGLLAAICGAVTARTLAR